MLGKVKWFDANKGFGFIETEEGNDVFVHFSDIQIDENNDTAWRELRENDEVEFETADTDRGPKAVQVRQK